MKQLPAGMRTHLATGATTLCWCWLVTRRDGTRQGFTDHDRDLSFNGVTYEAAAGFTASDLKDVIGLSVDNLEVSGAVSSGRLSEEELASGRYDDAKVEIFRVNWQDTAQRLLMRSGSIGEVRRDGTAFFAEIRGLAHYLQQPMGRLFQYTCDAAVGDRRCGVDLTAATFRGSGAVVSVRDARRLTVAGLDSFATNWFSRGLVSFTSGAAAGQSVEVKSHSVSGSVVTLELWTAVCPPPLPGQTFVVTAGCDKHFGTCSAKYGNAVNYRGFPFMPGNDFVTRQA